MAALSFFFIQELHCEGVFSPSNLLLSWSSYKSWTHGDSSLSLGMTPLSICFIHLLTLPGGIPQPVFPIEKPCNTDCFPPRDRFGQRSGGFLGFLLVVKFRSPAVRLPPTCCIPDSLHPSPGTHPGLSPPKASHTPHDSQPQD